MNFFEAIYPELPENSKILIWEPPGRSRWFGSIEEAAKAAEACDGDIYYQVGLSGADHGGGRRCSGNEAECRPVIGLPGVWADIDLKSEVKGGSLPETVDDALRVVTGFGMDPTMVVHTGHGLHVYWLFREIWSLETPESRQEARTFLARVKALIKERASDFGWSVDSVQDIARVLRIPGTYNCKNGSKKIVEILSYDEDRRYNPEDMEEWLPEAADSDSACTVVSCGSLELRADATVPPIMLQAMRELDAGFNETWMCENPRLKKNDKGLPGNSYDQSLANYAALAGWTDQQIADLLIQFRRKNGDQPEKALRADYVMRTISKARNGFESEAEINNNIENIKKQIELETAEIKTQAKDQVAFLKEQLKAETIKNKAYTKALKEQVKAETAQLKEKAKTETVLLREQAKANAAKLKEQARTTLRAEKEKIKISRQQALDKLVAVHKAELLKTIQSDGLPTIIVNVEEPQETVAKILQAIDMANNPPKIFQQENRLVRVIENDGHAAIDILEEYGLRLLLGDMMHFIIETKTTLTKTGPTRDQVNMVLRAGKYNVPKITGISYTPIVQKDGYIMDVGGYDEETETWYCATGGLEKIRIPDKPTKQDAIDAIEFVIEEILHDFPFIDQTARANALGMMLSPLMLRYISGKIPMAVVTATTAGTSKSLLCELAAIIATGRRAAMNSIVKNEEEFSKKLTSCLLSGQPVTVFDDTPTSLKVNSNSLHKALTSDTVQDRGFHTQKIISSPVNTVFILNGNNVNLDGGIPRRSYKIKMDPKTANPHLRSGFRKEYDSLLTWTQKNRADIVEALLTTIRAWFVAGKPKGNGRNIGGFNEWSSVIGGILEYADVKSFLSSYRSDVETADISTVEWEFFFRTWYGYYKEEPQPPWLLYEDLYPEGSKSLSALGESLPSKLKISIEKNGRQGFLVSLGKTFSAKEGKRFGIEEFAIYRVEVSRTSQSMWKVVKHNATVTDLAGEKAIRGLQGIEVAEVTV